MRKICTRILALLLLVTPAILQAQQIQIPFNTNWEFTGGSVSGEIIHEKVNIPHTWNAFDAQEGMSYYRGDGTYLKSFVPDENWKNKRVFIRFNGVMTLANVFLNNELLGEHRGGYSAFIFEISKKLKFGEENTLKVMANNEYSLEILPLFGDFNIYGGMYRPVNLIVSEPICISPLDYASPGIYLKQSNVSEKSADVEVKVNLSNGTDKTENIEVISSIYNAENELIESKKTLVEIKPGESNFSEFFTLKNPILWNGLKKAYLYKTQVELVQNGDLIDSKSEPLGLRYFKVDPNKGFFLNGKHLPLHGVSRHQDRKDKGSAISYADHKQDVDLMLEMGVNSFRLAHYQHSEIIYDLADSAGIVVWAEMPWVGGPGSLQGGSDGYEATEAFHNNAKQQLHELLRQNYNHPSIIFWSIFNEIQNPKDKSPVDFIHELNNIVKAEDPSRISVGASMLDPKENIHDITDAIAWNRYFGWYYKQPEDMGIFLDETHEKYPELCIGISEYGAGGSIVQHQQKLERPNPFGSPHPEEWQSYYHEQNLKVFKERQFVWGTFLWNMFDFGSHFRREGDHYGINDKGLITFDRKVKKDAFYFYKANWSTEPVLHITSKRHLFRDQEKTNVKVYSNLPAVTLTFNGKEMGSKSPVDGIVIWENLLLTQGNNGVKVSGTFQGETLNDNCTWVLDNSFGTKQIAQIYDLFKTITPLLIVVFLFLLWLWYFAWRKKENKPKWKRILAKIFFFVFLLVEIVLFKAKILISTHLG